MLTNTSMRSTLFSINILYSSTSTETIKQKYIKPVRMKILLDIPLNSISY